MKLISNRPSCAGRGTSAAALRSPSRWVSRSAGELPLPIQPCPLATARRYAAGLCPPIGAPAALGEPHAHRGHFRLEVAGGDAEQQPAPRQHVQAGDLLGQHHRIALRQDEDPGAQFHPLGQRGHIGQVHQGVEDRVGGRHRRVGHPGAGQHHLIPHPPGAVTQLLCPTCQLCRETDIVRLRRSPVSSPTHRKDFPPPLLGDHLGEYGVGEQHHGGNVVLMQRAP